MGSRIASLIIVVVLCLMSSCKDREDWVNGNTEEPGGKDYAAQFSNYSEIKLNITSQFADVVYSVYYGYPYEEGSLVKDPYMVGKTPIAVSMKIPKDIEKLYILGNGKMIESDVKDITINDDTPDSRSGGSRSSDISAAALAAVHSTFPEKNYNFGGTDLYKCTDLEIAATESTGDFNEAEIWITYVSDGGFSKGTFPQYGKLWFYTYPTEKIDNLTVADCTFYGRNGSSIVKVDYNSIFKKSSSNNRNSDENPIFASWVEQPKAKNGEYTRVSLGVFPKGVNVGFMFRGSDERPQFTTPTLNLSLDATHYQGVLSIDAPNKDHDYIGKKANGFEVTQQIANGFICHINEEGFEANVLGMENRTVGYRTYDGDYNDMLCLIESNPVALKPLDPVTPPEVDDYTVEKGYYLFEDNYPETGDFDFNDVVVEYNIITYTKTAYQTKQVSAKLLAYGCNYANEFGFKVEGGDYVPFLTGIKGYKNVSGDNTVDETSSQLVTKSLNGHIKCYLNNGKGYIFDTNYNTGDFPYVLDIPISDGAPFRWCVEGKRMDDAYKFKERVEGWYVMPKDENLVVKW